MSTANALNWLIDRLLDFQVWLEGRGSLANILSLAAAILAIYIFERFRLKR